METAIPPAILVVEDMAVIRMDAVATIEEAGFRAYEAASADEGIRMLEKHPDIAVLFTDVDMPGGMNGLALAHYARNRWPPVEIIIASGAANPVKSDLPDRTHFLPKPYPMHHVIAVLHNLATTGMSSGFQRRTS